VAGSAKLVQGLLEADLVDELRLATYPVILGVGKRLFPLGVRLDFELDETTTTRTGVVLATYRRPSGDGPGGDPHPFADR
jgi:dihydrofolate reductase